MADLLVKLYERRAEPETCAGNIRIFRPLPPDRTAVVDFVRRTFGEKWASECETAFFGFPVRMWIAADGGKVVGFACYDCTARGFFGPTGVLPGYRGRGIGKNLLLRCLDGLGSGVRLRGDRGRGGEKFRLLRQSVRRRAYPRERTGHLSGPALTQASKKPRTKRRKGYERIDRRTHCAG